MTKDQGSESDRDFKAIFTPQQFADDLVEIAGEYHRQNAELALVHLRDARNMVFALADHPENRAMSKAAILLAAAALESNLTYLSGLAAKFIEARPDKFTRSHADLLRGFTEEINESGKRVNKSIHQSLLERMQIIPQLLARAVDRRYELPSESAAGKKMQRMIERRDAIIHPRWDRYIAAAGWWEAAEAVDAVELYLQSIRQCLQRYVMGYTFMLVTIKGPTKDDVGIGHRTFGKKGPHRKVSSMGGVGIVRVLTGEWCDALLLTMLALNQGTDLESEGSLFTRSALVLTYAMLDAQLSVVAQWKMREHPTSFDSTEVNFLNEAASRVGHDGEVWIENEQHPFKKRVKAIPIVLARSIEQKEILVDLGTMALR